MRRFPAFLAAVPSLCFACSEAPEAVAPDAGFGASLSPSPATIAAPVFGLGASPDGGVFAAQTFLGVVTELRGGAAVPAAQLSGVSDVAAVGRGNLLAVSWGNAPTHPSKLWRVSRGGVHEVADLFAFEEAVNPDQVWNPLPPESNPFNLVALSGGSVLVADAAANAILTVAANGDVDWVAVLTPHLVPTAPLKTFLGCPNAAIPLCGLPDQLPAQPVATSVAVGPDGAYYAGELTGFPGTPGMSRIWRIEAGSRHVLCPSSDCTMVADGLTSIMDLAFGPDGRLYVVEFDAAGWFAVELASAGGPLAPVEGGTVKACDVDTGTCATYASGLSLPAAIATLKDGSIWVAQNSTIPGTAEVGPID